MISLPLIHIHICTGVFDAQAISIFISYCSHYVCRRADYLTIMH